MKRRAILRRSVGGSLLLLACSASSHLHAAVATWGDELNNAPTVVRPDGNVWRDYPPGEAGGQLNALVEQRPETWFVPRRRAAGEGSVPWNGQASNKGPLQNMSDMTFQFRFKLGSDPNTDPTNVWEPRTDTDGLEADVIDNNLFTIEQETYGTVKWGWTFGYERRPDADAWPIVDANLRGVSMQFFGKANRDFNYTALAWDTHPLENNKWYVGRVVADWNGPENPDSTISIYLGPDENNLQLLLREDSDPSQPFTQSLFESDDVYLGDYNLTVIKHGRWGAVEFDYFRAYAGVLPVDVPLLPAVSSPTGDFNQDGVLDAADINALTTAVRGGTNPLPYDLNNDKLVNDSDRNAWVSDLKKTWFGDANLDMEFNSLDLVLTFQDGQFEDATPGNSLWESGDWDGDGDFTTGDFVLAFQGGGYEKGPKPAVAAVPEPSGLLPLLFGGLLTAALRRRR